MIRYQEELQTLTANQLQGFFVGWPNPPSSETHLKLLQKSDYIVLAFEAEQVVGFITAISDQVLSAYIPLLEVLPSHQGQGIGKTLVQKMHSQLAHLYMVDLCCDTSLVPFYQELGWTQSQGMIRRHYDFQSGSQEKEAL